MKKPACQKRERELELERAAKRQKFNKPGEQVSNLSFEREDLWGTMSQCFKYSFGNKTTVIIDCLEVFLIDNQICLQEHRHVHRTNTTTLLRCWLGYLLKAQSPTFPKRGEDEHKTNF